MEWIILVGLEVAGLMIILFVLLADGRYFGKRLMYWVYDRVGPDVFSTYREVESRRPQIESIGLQEDENVLDVKTVPKISSSAPKHLCYRPRELRDLLVKVLEWRL